MHSRLGLRHVRISKVACSALVILNGAWIASSLQMMASQLAEAPAATHAGNQAPAGAVGYLQGAEPNFLQLLPPYPVLGTMQDEMDVATFRQMQEPDTSARWKLAEADDQMTYARFSGVLGIDLDAANLPIVIHLLNRTERDVLDTAFDAKRYFDRPRPFQRFIVAHVCGADSSPLPEAHPNGGFSASSYPSGHSAFGWGLALVLAEIAPDRAQVILSRGHEYDESRVVCAVHFPSDVAAGEIVATAVIERLHAVPEFARDLACAQQEYLAATKASVPMRPECSAMEKSLNKAQ